MIYFLSEQPAPNYLNPEASDIYSTFSLGKISHIAYYYWILKNNGIDGVELVTDTSKMEDGDVVFFYQPDRDAIVKPYTTLDIGKKITKIQVVGDTNLKVEADYYAINDPSFVDDRKFYLPFPLPANMVSGFIPQWPPKVFGCACHEFNLHPDFFKKKYQREFAKMGIELYLEHKVNHITKPIDVHFFIRNPYLHLMMKHDGSPKHPVAGYKHPNRLYQSWIMGVPSIFNPNSAMDAVDKSRYSYLPAKNGDEFIYQANNLINDLDLWRHMLHHAKNQNVREDSNVRIINELRTFLKTSIGYNV